MERVLLQLGPASQRCRDWPLRGKESGLDWQLAFVLIQKSSFYILQTSQITYFLRNIKQNLLLQKRASCEKKIQGLKEFGPMVKVWWAGNLFPSLQLSHCSKASIPQCLRVDLGRAGTMEEEGMDKNRFPIPLMETFTGSKKCLPSEERHHLIQPIVSISVGYIFDWYSLNCELPKK